MGSRIKDLLVVCYFKAKVSSTRRPESFCRIHFFVCTSCVCVKVFTTGQHVERQMVLHFQTSIKAPWRQEKREEKRNMLCSLPVLVLVCVPLLCCCAWGCLLLHPGSYEVFRATPTETPKHPDNVRLWRECERLTADAQEPFLFLSPD